MLHSRSGLYGDAVLQQDITKWSLTYNQSSHKVSSWDILVNVIFGPYFPMVKTPSIPKLSGSGNDKVLSID